MWLVHSCQSSLRSSSAIHKSCSPNLLLNTSESSEKHSQHLIFSFKKLSISPRLCSYSIINSLAIFDIIEPPLRLGFWVSLPSRRDTIQTVGLGYSLPHLSCLWWRYAIHNALLKHHQKILILDRRRRVAHSLLSTLVLDRNLKMILARTEFYFWKDVWCFRLRLKLYLWFLLAFRLAP